MAKGRNEKAEAGFELAAGEKTAKGHFTGPPRFVLIAVIALTLLGAIVAMAWIKRNGQSVSGIKAENGATIQVDQKKADAAAGDQSVKDIEADGSAVKIRQETQGGDGSTGERR